MKSRIIIGIISLILSWIILISYYLSQNIILWVLICMFVTMGITNFLIQIYDLYQDRKLMKKIYSAFPTISYLK